MFLVFVEYDCEFWGTQIIIIIIFVYLLFLFFNSRESSSVPYVIVKEGPHLGYLIMNFILS